MYETDTHLETNSKFAPGNGWDWNTRMFVSFWGNWPKGRTVRFSKYITDLRNMKLNLSRI